VVESTGDLRSGLGWERKTHAEQGKELDQPETCGQSLSGIGRPSPIKYLVRVMRDAKWRRSEHFYPHIMELITSKSITAKTTV